MNVKQTLKETFRSVNVPKLRHQILKSLSEVQSERDNAPECKCGTNDDAECDLRDVAKCIRLEREREYGVVDERDQFAGRGLPKF